VATKKRSLPTKLRVKDSDAIQSLVAFGINHRAAIADQCFKRFQQTQSSADRISLAIECFVCMMANIEDLEKAYFALRRKAAGNRGSFFELFTHTSVCEPQPKAKFIANERSARMARRQLQAMGLGVFRVTLGLPTFEEWRMLGRAPARLRPRELRNMYHAELCGLKKRMRQAMKNRATKRLMNVYNKCKHGFVVLHGENPPTAWLIERAYGRQRTTCWVQCFPFVVNEAATRSFFENTRTVAMTMRTLLTLFGRIEMVPPLA